MSTQFVESNALLALLNEDEDEADRILKDMYPGELGRLAAACGLLASMARCEMRDQRERARR